MADRQGRPPHRRSLQASQGPLIPQAARLKCHRGVIGECCWLMLQSYSQTAPVYLWTRFSKWRACCSASKTVSWTEPAGRWSSLSLWACRCPARYALSSQPAQAMSKCPCRCLPDGALTAGSRCRSCPRTIAVRPLSGVCRPQSQIPVAAVAASQPAYGHSGVTALLQPMQEGAGSHISVLEGCSSTTSTLLRQKVHHWLPSYVPLLLSVCMTLGQRRRQC